MSCRKSTHIFLMVLLGTAVLYSQAPPAPKGSSPQPAPTFKANSRLVLVDVVVSNGNGEPVHNLKQQDFTVLEDGKPQTLVSFDEQRPDAKAKTAPAEVNLPANVYTNYTTRTESGALTVLLFDLLNTDRPDLVYAKNEMLSFLKKLPPGKRVALFTLGSQLKMVQGFTEDSDQLIAAAQQISMLPNPVYTNSKQLSGAIAEARESGIAKSPAAFRSLVQFLGEDYQGKLDSRSQDTLDALTQLAHALAVLPGRKNLIWISGGFPFDIAGNAQRAQRVTASQLPKVAALLAANRIAVYPVDARGVLTMAADASTRSSEIFGQREAYETLSGQYAENISIVETLNDMAKLTGGRAYINRNDLDSAIADGMRTGASYYSLAYRPVNQNWDGKFRKITVKAPQPDLKLLYRSGYYALLDPLNSKQDPDRMISLAMQPNVPVSTQLIMKARVVPPQEAGQATAIEMFIDAHDLTFTEGTEKQKTPLVQFVAVAYDGSGKQSNSFSLGFHPTLAPVQMEALLRSGVGLHQELLLKPGSYQLRLGVMDRLSGRIGTLDIPLTIEAKAAAK
jgi:VWFA-related protein